MVQVQLRMPEKTVKNIDALVAEGRFKSRSEAIKMMVAFYEEREKTRQFLKMLVERSKDAGEKPQILIPLEKLK